MLKEAYLLLTDPIDFISVAHLGLKLGYVGYRRQTSTGADSDSFILSLSTFW